MPKRRQKYVIILTNCDCCSDTIARPRSSVNRYMFGPRCMCGQILGPMQWMTDGEFMADSELSAVETYRKHQKQQRMATTDGTMIWKGKGKRVLAIVDGQEEYIFAKTFLEYEDAVTSVYYRDRNVFMHKAVIEQRQKQQEKKGDKKERHNIRPRKSAPIDEDSG